MSSNEVKFISEHNEKDFGEEYFDFFKFDSIIFLTYVTNRSVVFSYIIYFNRNFLKNSYKFCDVLNVTKTFHQLTQL
jgi:hypothetical protein